jgi:hypothetical protein
MEHKIFQTQGGKTQEKTTYMPMGYLTVGYGYLSHITGISWNMIGI